MSTPTKEKAFRQQIDNAHSEFYFVWNTFRDKLPPMAIYHLEAGLKILADLIEETKPKAESREKGKP